MSDDEFWSKLRIAGDMMRAGRERLSETPVTKEEAMAQQERALAGKTKDAPFMAPFRVDISKVRTGAKQDGLGCWNAWRLEDGKKVYGYASTARWAYANAGVPMQEDATMQPHPWKRADGSHIKASWEE